MRRKQVNPVTTGGFTAISKCQVAIYSSVLLLLPFNLIVFNRGGKMCLLLHVFLCVLLAFKSMSRMTEN